MSKDLFPSGPWSGFYNYSGFKEKHGMDLFLRFHQGVVNGYGHDDVGPFLVHGKYDAPALECHWTKSYLGAHEVFYQGYREGKGIWGTWEMPEGRGGFHIWPRGSEEEGEVARAAAVQPAQQSAETDAHGVEASSDSIGT